MGISNVKRSDSANSIATKIASRMLTLAHGTSSVPGEATLLVCVDIPEENGKGFNSGLGASGFAEDFEMIPSLWRHLRAVAVTLGLSVELTINGERFQ